MTMTYSYVIKFSTVTETETIGSVKGRIIAVDCGNLERNEINESR